MKKTCTNCSEEKTETLRGLSFLKTCWAALLPVTKALANGSIKKAVTLLLNSSDTTIKENATKAIQYVIDRECYSFSDRDMNIQLQKTATRVNWKTLTYRKFNEILKPMHLYCGLVHLKLQHQNTAKHLILSKFVQLSVYWFKGGQEFLILFNML